MSVRGHLYAALKNFMYIQFMILLYFYFSKILNAGLVIGLFLHCCVGTFTSEKDLKTSSTSQCN